MVLTRIIQDVQFKAKRTLSYGSETDWMLQNVHLIKFYTVCYSTSCEIPKTIYSTTPMTRTPIARLPWLIRTRF